jgi:hypothetical protein
MASALERLGLDYVLVGGQVAIYYGLGRTTMDADFVVQLASCGIETVARELGPAFRLDPQRRFEVFTHKQCFTIDVVGTPYTLEVFLASDDPFDTEAFQRRNRVMLHGHSLFISTPEDLLINKLRWRRPKDLVDAADVLSIRGDSLDWPYIERWCDAHGTRQVLEDLRREIPPIQ